MRQRLLPRGTGFLAIKGNWCANRANFVGDAQDRLMMALSRTIHFNHG